jgi:hypothetical protein
MHQENVRSWGAGEFLEFLPAKIGRLLDLGNMERPRIPRGFV